MKNKSTFLFTFFHAMKKYFFLPVLIGLGIFAGHVMSLNQVFYEIVMPAKEKAIQLGAENFRELLKDVKYSFIYIPQDGWSSSADQLSVFLIISIILSAFLGIFLFKFVTNKKTVNVYYSLGIKRAELFTSRYLSGAVMILLAIALPLLIIAFANIYLFGSNIMLWKAFFFYFFHYSVICLAAYTIAAAVSGCIGTIFESVGFTAILLAFPLFAYMCFKNIISVFLHGAPAVDTFLFTFNSENSRFIKISLDNMLIGKILNNFDLFTLNRDTFYSMGQVADAQSAKTFSFPSIIPYLLWMIFIIAIFFIGVYMFKYRKSEICGFTGKNKLLNSTASALITLFIISIIVKYINNIFVLILLSLFISFVVFSVIELILTRNIKEYKKALKIAPVHAVLVIALLTILSTGAFGYSKKIPQIKEIESVQISVPNGIIGKDDSRLYDSYRDLQYPLSIDDKNFNYFYVNTTDRNVIFPEIKDPDTIKKVLDIHKNFIDYGNVYKETEHDRLSYSKRSTLAKVAIIYNLKDGKQFVRYYDRIKSSALLDLLSIEDSKVWHNYIDKEFANRDLDNTIPVIFSKQMDKRTFVDARLRENLLKALALDMKTLNAKDIWTPKSEYLGAITVYDNPTFSSNPNGLKDPSMDAAAHIAGKDATPEEIIAKSWQLDEKQKYFSLYQDSFSTIIPITADFKNTVKFLKDNNIYSAFSDDSKVVSARYIEAKVPTASRELLSEDSLPIFNEFWDIGTNKAYSEEIDGTAYITNYESGALMPKGSKTVTDRNTLDALLNNAYGSYLDIDGDSAYIVEFKRENGALTIMYVPSGRITIK